MIFDKLPLVLLLSIGFAGITTASLSEANGALDLGALDAVLEARQNGKKGGKINNGRKQNGGNNAAAAANTSVAAAAAATGATASAAANAGTGAAAQPAAAQGGAATATTLNADAIQTGSNNNGLAVAEAGQSASLTDPANFINFCSGKTLTNGLQQKQGSCNGIVMGDIPANTNMVSSIIINPQPGQDLTPNQSFNVQVQVANLKAGSFTNPQVTYYAAPQVVEGGQIVGHTHVTIQDMGNSLTPGQPLDAQKFAFFKGINDAGNGNGLLQAVVTGGLPAGNYRVCTMASSSNHQPVLMPVAQRGAQDDCTKFTVGQGGGAAAAAAPVAAAAAGGAGNTATAAAAAGGAANATAAAAPAAASAAGGTGGKGAKKGGKKGGKLRFAARAFNA